MTRKHIQTLCLMLFVAGLTVVFAGASWASYSKEEKAIERIGPEDARKLVDSGQALLVCSYDDNTCKSFLFQGALRKSEFEARLASLSKDQAIIFYCQ